MIIQHWYGSAAVPEGEPDVLTESYSITDQETAVFSYITFNGDGGAITGTTGNTLQAADGFGPGTFYARVRRISGDTTRLAANVNNFSGWQTNYPDDTWALIPSRFGVRATAPGTYSVRFYVDIATAASEGAIVKTFDCTTSLEIT